MIDLYHTLLYTEISVVNNIGERYRLRTGMMLMNGQMQRWKNAPKQRNSLKGVTNPRLAWGWLYELTLRETPIDVLCFLACFPFFCTCVLGIGLLGWSWYSVHRPNLPPIPLLPCFSVACSSIYFGLASLLPFVFFLFSYMAFSHCLPCYVYQSVLSQTSYYHRS